MATSPTTTPSDTPSYDAPRVSCLVTGATGYVGGRLVPHLLAAGHDVRALARTPSKLDEVPWRDDVDVVEGDLADEASLEAAFTGMDVVYHLVHSMGGADDFAAEEAKTARNVVSAAQSAGVDRIVYLSGLHPRDDDNWSEHLASRIEVGRILLDSSIETIVLQAGVVIGSGSASFELIRHLTERLPVMTTPQWVHNRIQPIAVRDAVHYLVAAATAEVPSSRTWDIGGPDVLTYGEMMATYAKVARLGRRHMVVLQPLTPTVASHWVGLVTPIPSGLARPLIESLEVDAIMLDRDVDDVIPRPDGGLTSYVDALHEALDHAQQGRVTLDWADTSLLDSPGEPVPSDPSWSRELVLSDRRSHRTSSSPEAMSTAVSALASTDVTLRYLTPQPTGVIARIVTGAPPDDEPSDASWELVTDDGAGRFLFRARARVPGTLWLEVRLAEDPEGDGTIHGQRLVFAPRGLGGIAWWHALLPWRSLAFQRLASHLEGGSDDHEVS